MFDFNGKVALVTGALGGIGKEYVAHLLLNGVRGVALIDLVDDCVAEEFQNELIKDVGENKTVYFKIDIENPQNITDAFEKTIKHFNQLDIVINNAAVVDEENYLKALNINLLATFHSTQLAIQKYLPKYRQSDEGIVVNTASIAGIIQFDMAPTYSVTKQAVVALGQTFGTPTYYKLNQVRILTLCPGPTDTPMIKNPIPEAAKKLFAHTLTWAYEGTQRPENCALALIKIIKEGKTGSVWITHREEPAFEVNFADFRSGLLKDIGYEVADPKFVP